MYAITLGSRHLACLVSAKIGIQSYLAVFTLTPTPCLCQRTITIQKSNLSLASVWYPFSLDRQRWENFTGKSLYWCGSQFWIRIRYIYKSESWFESLTKYTGRTVSLSNKSGIWESEKDISFSVGLFLSGSLNP